MQEIFAKTLSPTRYLIRRMYSRPNDITLADNDPKTDIMNWRPWVLLLSRADKRRIRDSSDMSSATRVFVRNKRGLPALNDNRSPSSTSSRPPNGILATGSHFLAYHISAHDGTSSMPVCNRCCRTFDRNVEEHQGAAVALLVLPAI